jgi:hypothetical protein
MFRRATNRRRSIVFATLLLGVCALSSGEPPQGAKSHAPPPPAATAMVPGGTASTSATVQPGASPRIDIEAHGATTAAVIAQLRGAHCVPVSFVEVESGQHLDLSLHQVTAPEVLQKISATISAYRFEAIRGRLVLYPTRPEYQAIVAGVDIAQQPRFGAASKYIETLRHAVPSFSKLASPGFLTLALGPSPFFDEQVTLRPKGRVIEHFVDLLGRAPRVYFNIAPAPTGVPAFSFDETSCPPVAAPIRFTSCFSEPEHGPGGLLDHKLAIDAGEVSVAALIDRLRTREHLPISFIQAGDDRRVSTSSRDLTARQLLQEVLSESPGAKCLIGSQHVVVLLGAAAATETRIAVKLEMRTPWMAANSYLRLLVHVTSFEDLYPWVEPPADPRLRTDEVSLSSEGTVLEHLVQILGDNTDAYFVISKAPSGKRVLALGSVAAQ